MTKTRLLARHMARAIERDETAAIGGAKMGTKKFFASGDRTFSKQHNNNDRPCDDMVEYD